MTILPHGVSPDSRQRPTVSIAWMYVIALLGTMFLGVIAIVVIILKRPEADNTALVTIIIGFCITQFTALTAAIKGQEAKHVAKENAYRVDGRLSDLLDAIAKQKELEGIIKGAGVVATVTQTTETPQP